jgi:hypothetical protein
MSRYILRHGIQGKIANRLPIFPEIHEDHSAFYAEKSTLSPNIPHIRGCIPAI